MVVTYVLMFVSPEIMESVQMIAWREVTLTDNLHCLVNSFIRRGFCNYCQL